MKGFGFSLAAGTSLREGPDGYFLLSRLPVRLLHVNRPLFRLLERMRDGGDLSDYVGQNPGLDEADLLNMLLSLADGGYLKLERIAAMDSYPHVSIVIPVRDQTTALADCLVSLSKLDYPPDRLEIIVVDDGSKKDVARIITSDVRIVRLKNSLGPASARNIGAQQAGGEILAFLDADCAAGEKWLKETVPFFRVPAIGAVGGYVDNFYKKSWLDRYEATSSSLNLGNRIIYGGKSSSTFYVPTANMLVRRESFMATGGFQAGMRIGEDVDFCWRLRDLGHSLLYVPGGRVDHKHRRRLDAMLSRRAQYGMSEAPLYRTHRDKKKAMQIPLCSGLSWLALVLAVALLNPYPLIAIPLLFGCDLWRRSRVTRKFKMGLPLIRLAGSALRSHLACYYFIFFHVVRYYLVLFIGFGVLWHPLWFLGGLALVYASVMDYLVKKPRLFYLIFLFGYLLEHLFYQVGVFWGCLKKGYFGSYLISIKIT
jgi:mycofactocin system glycosyltransferase